MLYIIVFSVKTLKGAALRTYKVVRIEKRQRSGSKGHKKMEECSLRTDPGVVKLDEQKR